ncbi:MAG TPA: MFS transporter [Chitinophagaceae bacterium]|nr:MFS transporter [Chitinophagaceae bacterium]
MINVTSLQKILNVRPSEWSIVTKLFWLQFFQGTGIAFFFTASFSRFLESFPATELAWVMIISSPFLFITGWIFNKFEHKLSLIKLGTGTIIAMAASILLFHLGSIYIDAGWFYYGLFAWYYVLYLSSNLGFWSITSTLFDVRQSKRLFSVISAGDIPAKFIGYTVAYFFVKAVGPINLLWPASIFMLGSLPFIYRISQMGVIKNHQHQHHQYRSQQEIIESTSGNRFWVIIKRFTLNTLIRRIAILTFLISCCLAIINYAFYAEIKDAHHDDKSLSNFILLFLAVSQIIAMLVKFIFTSRIITVLGIKKSLLITPLVLITLLLLILTAEMFLGNHKIIFYAFGAAAIAIEVLKTAINTPVFLSVMQPLNHAERTKAHAIVKGIMDPFAFLFSGVLLLFLTFKLQDYSLLGIIFVLIFFTLAWLISIVLVDKSYRHILLKTISSRYFSQDDFTLSDEDIRNQIRKKIKTGNELEVINILQMLNSQIRSESKEIIFDLLDHPSDNVKKETILLIQNRKLKGAAAKLQQLANHSNNNDVKWLAVQTLCLEENSHAHQKHFSHHLQPEIRAAAFSGMLLSKDLHAIQEAEIKIGELIQSADEQEKMLAVFVLNKVKDYYMHPLHAHLFNESKEIRFRAIQALGKSATENILFSIFNLFKENQRAVLDALQAAAERAVPVIYMNLYSGQYPPELKERLIGLLGKIGGPASHEVLLKLLTEYPKDASLVVKALHRSRFKSTTETRDLLEKISFEFLVYAVELLYMQKNLNPDQPNYTVLISALNMELLEIRNVLLSIFGCLYDHEKIFKIKQGLDMKKKDTIANAMELIEVTVKKELASKFNTLYEPADIDQKCYLLKGMFPQQAIQKAEEILDRILEEKPIYYTSWTKAYSMYVSKKYNVPVNPELIKKYIHSENQLLHETALYSV